MQNFTGVCYESSEQHKDQHKECSVTRSSRDYKDAFKILRYLEVRNPFEGYPNLICIETGEVGDDKVDVYKSEEIGNGIISSMVGQPIFTYSFKKKDMAITMKPRSSVVIDGEVVSVDPQLLFQRLLITVGRDDVQLQNALTYELCNHPASLFGKNGLMREANKPALAEEIWKRVDDNVKLPDNVKYVLDGGYLLHKLKWRKGETFNDIFKSYNDYVLKHYGPGTVIVFDGYPRGPTTKDSTHMRRRAKKMARSVNITPYMKLNMSKESFMSVLQNKQLFNEMLVTYMNESEDALTAIQSDSDADLLVVQTAISCSKDSDVVIGEDMDLLVLLIHHAKLDNCPNSIYLTAEEKSTSKSKPKLWDIFETKKVLGLDVSENILAIHAILGCDTTSRIHNIGKGHSLKKFIANDEFRYHLSKFGNLNATQNEIAESGEKLYGILYGEKNELNLWNLCYRMFCKKVASSKTVVLPEDLPPTSDAAKFHSFRVFHQVQVWKGNESLSAEHWGWFVKDNFMLPKLMEQPPAPTDLLKLIKCNCKTDCASNRCSCQKHGLNCTPMCGVCKGVSCLNCQDVDLSEDTQEK